MKRFIVSMIMLAIASVAGAQETAEIVATINGEVLTKKEFERMWADLPADMQRNYERSGGKMTFLDNYIRKRLVIQEAIKEDFDDREDVRYEVRKAQEDALFDAYVRMVVSQAVIPDSEVRQIYEEQKSRFRQPKAVKARHIVATADAMAVSNTADSNAASRPEAHEKMINIRKQLETNPGSFANLAQQFSEDMSASTGGDLGWFSPGQMVPEFDQIVFDMKPGEISPVFESRFGYHVVQVDAVRPERIIPFDEAKHMIRGELLKERTEKIMSEVQTLTQQLRAQSSISVNREHL